MVPKTCRHRGNKMLYCWRNQMLFTSHVSNIHAIPFSSMTLELYRCPSLHFLSTSHLCIGSSHGFTTHCSTWFNLFRHRDRIPVRDSHHFFSTWTDPIDHSFSAIVLQFDRLLWQIFASVCSHCCFLISDADPVSFIDITFSATVLSSIFNLMFGQRALALLPPFSIRGNPFAFLSGMTFITILIRSSCVAVSASLPFLDTYNTG